MNKREEFEKALEAYCDTIGGPSAPAVAAHAQVMALFDAAQPSQDGLPELPTVITWTETGSPRYTADQMLAYGAQCRDAAVPEGYVVVPCEPTEAMLRALGGTKAYEGDIYSIRRKAAYKAVLAAAKKDET
jgi:hypothetical protein